LCQKQHWIEVANQSRNLANEWMLLWLSSLLIVVIWSLNNIVNIHCNTSICTILYYIRFNSIKALDCDHLLRYSISQHKKFSTS
jgi:hypothetical protein